MVNTRAKNAGFLLAVGLGAIVLVLAAWLRGAEYDEQYTLFLTAGLPRPPWPDGVFPAVLARVWQAGSADPIRIGADLRNTDVHPPLYFWLIGLWRMVFGPDLFAARLFSVLCGTGALALVGAIARRSGIPPVRAMFLTLGCYAFTYTNAVARGFALADVLLLGGVLCLQTSRRARYTLTAGVLFGAASLTNYLSVFVAGACLGLLVLEMMFPRWHPGETTGAIRHAWATAACFVGFGLFLPADLFWFLAQKSSREGQFPPFSLVSAVIRLGNRAAGAVLGGLPLYASGVAAVGLTIALGLLLALLIATVICRWRRIGTPRARTLFAMAAVAPGLGLLLLGAIFDNAPIELRYLAFAMPFVGLLLAGALSGSWASALLAVQAAAIAGLMLGQATMQPARAMARAAARLAGGGVVLVPRGNDGVGVVGAFGIEAPEPLPILIINPNDSLDRLRGFNRVVLVPMEQDAGSRAAVAALRRVLVEPSWREVAREGAVAVYERSGGGG